MVCEWPLSMYIAYIVFLNKVSCHCDFKVLFPFWYCEFLLNFLILRIRCLKFWWKFWKLRGYFLRDFNSILVFVKRFIELFWFFKSSINSNIRSNNFSWKIPWRPPAPTPIVLATPLGKKENDLWTRLVLCSFLDALQPSHHRPFGHFQFF